MMQVYIKSNMLLRPSCHGGLLLVLLDIKHFSELEVRKRHTPLSHEWRVLTLTPVARWVSAKEESHCLRLRHR